MYRSQAGHIGSTLRHVGTHISDVDYPDDSLGGLRNGFGGEGEKLRPVVSVSISYSVLVGSSRLEVEDLNGVDPAVPTSLRIGLGGSLSYEDISSCNSS